MTFGQRVVRVATDVTVRWPRLWPVFRWLLRRQFGKLAPRWENVLQPDTLAPLESALERIDRPVADALDIGTGTGAAARAVARRFPDATVVGVDVAPEMIEHARRLAPDLRFEVADAARLPFADGSFDLVTHANAIPFAAEVARVLRSGGAVVVAFSSGDQTPIYVSGARLRNAFGAHGLSGFDEFRAARGTAFVARKR